MSDAEKKIEEVQEIDPADESWELEPDEPATDGEADR